MKAGFSKYESNSGLPWYFLCFVRKVESIDPDLVLCHDTGKLFKFSFFLKIFFMASSTSHSHSKFSTIWLFYKALGK